MGLFDEIFGLFKTAPALGHYYAGGANVTQRILQTGQIKLTDAVVQPVPPVRHNNDQVLVPTPSTTQTGALKPVTRTQAGPPGGQVSVNNAVSRTVQMPKPTYFAPQTTQFKMGPQGVVLQGKPFAMAAYANGGWSLIPYLGWKRP